MTNAIAPVAADIIPGRPPTKLMTTAIQNEAYKPTLGSTPAIIEKAIASGIRARATTSPESTSPRTFENHSSRIVFNEGTIISFGSIICWVLFYDDSHVK